jgi:hypothetical protein
MRLDEFVKPEDATMYDPAEDRLNQHHRDDTRKDKLTLKDVNHLKKMRALKKLEAMKRQDILSVMYAKPAGGDMGGGFT